MATMKSDASLPTPLQRQLRKKNPFSSPAQEAHLNLARTHEFLSGHFARFFKQHGLSWTQYNILRILKGQGGEGVACQEIGDQMVTLVPDVTRLVDRLTEAGLVERHRTPKDRRVVLVALTEAGSQLLDRLEQPVLELHEHTLGHLTIAELNALSLLLAKARQPWEELAAGVEHSAEASARGVFSEF
jgi:DNA-binding MarR family transcriptional regulator